MKNTIYKTLLPLALFSASTSVNALTMSVETEAYAPAGSTGVQQSNVNNTGSGSVQAYSSDIATDFSSSASSRAFLRDDGLMGARSSGNGISYSSQSEISWSDTYTNVSLGAEEIAFDFHIWGGSLGTWGLDNTGESASSSYWIDILVNGTSVWSSEATLTSTTTSTGTLIETGTSLNGALTDFGSGDTYSWSSTTETLNLGILDVGETLTLEYIMGTSSSGTGIDEIAVCADGEWEQETELGCSGVGSWSGIGDPFGFSSSSFPPPTISATAVANVPEPETILLLGAGVFAMGLVSRRKKAKALAAK